MGVRRKKSSEPRLISALRRRWLCFSSPAAGTGSAAETIYNSFLPEIAPPEERDAVSSKGFGIGYLGGGLLLALNLLLYLGRDKIGISEAMAVRISLCSAGVWWAGFTIPTLL